MGINWSKLSKVTRLLRLGQWLTKFAHQNHLGNSLIIAFRDCDLIGLG